MNHRLRILTIGHSYCVPMNRALVREVPRGPDLDITVAAPRSFHGDLRPIAMEPEPPGSQLRVVPLDTKRSRFIHVFEYDGAALRELVRKGDFDVVHAWEEPYILAGYQIARELQNNPARFCFRTAQSYVKRYPPIWLLRANRPCSSTGMDCGCQLGLSGHARAGVPERERTDTKPGRRPSRVSAVIV